MTPEDVVAQALHDVWQPVENCEQFPSRWTQATYLLDALRASGYRVVKHDTLEELCNTQERT